MGRAASGAPANAQAGWHRALIAPLRMAGQPFIIFL